MFRFHAAPFRLSHPNDRVGTAFLLLINLLRLCWPWRLTPCVSARLSSASQSPFLVDSVLPFGVEMGFYLSIFFAGLPPHTQITAT